MIGEVLRVMCTLVSALCLLLNMCVLVRGNHELGPLT